MTTAAQEPRRHWTARAIATAPDAILIPLLTLCVTVTVTIMCGVFTPWLVLPLTVVVSAALWRFRPRWSARRFDWQSALVAIIGIVVWVGVNVPFAAQWLDVSRDPGFLTLEGVWLSHHSSPGIPLGELGTAALQAVPGAQASDTAGFAYSDGLLHAQGAKLVPGLVAMVGWVLGVHGVLVGNLAIGAVALLAFYGFARRLLGPVWSLAALFALAASMPFTYFSRAVYTEPIVLAVTFGGLTLLWVAHRSGRWYHFALGGALIGAGGLARIDGTAIVIGLTAGAALATAAVAGRGRRVPALGRLLLITIPAFAVTALGIAELTIDSPSYTHALGRQLRGLEEAAVAVFIVALVLASRWPWERLRRTLLNHRTGAGNAVLVIVLAVGAFMLSRPWWYVHHSGLNLLTQGLQRRERLHIDGTQDYSELSLNWFAMYLSWVTVGAGLIGIAVMARVAVVRRDARYLLFIAVTAAPTLLYLWTDSISPDQVWAMRRYLPVSIPGFIIFALWTLRGASRWALRRATRSRAIGVTGAVVTIGLAAVAVVFPVYPWVKSDLFRTVEHGGRLPLSDSVCRVVGDRPVAYVIDPTATKEVNTLRIMCGVTAIGFPAAPTAAQLTALDKVWGGQALVLTFQREQVPWTIPVAQVQPTVAAAISTWPYWLNLRPTEPVWGTANAYIGTVGSNGLVTPLAG